MSIIRKRSASHKTFIPGNARDNQYILAEFTITDQLLEKFTPENNQSDQPYQGFYQTVSDIFFQLCNTFELSNCQFIANDKLARVRFSQEMHQWQTNQQILFYYNPSEHKLNKTFFDGHVRAEKITLLVLASGLDIRLNAALLHAKVEKVLSLLSQELSLNTGDIRLRDHQHITYDLFAKQKGCDKTQVHKLRPIPLRYQHQHLPINQTVSEINYVVVNIPVTNQLLNLVDVDPDSADPYNPLYTFITDAITQSAKRYNLNNGALIANGLIPIVRYSEYEATSIKGELQMLGYNPKQNQCGLISKWNAQELVDDVQLIFVATEENCSDYGYGRFLNQVEQALRLFTTELEIAPIKEEVTIRFHQHAAYNI